MSAERGPLQAEHLVAAFEVEKITGRPKHIMWYWEKHPERFGFPRPVRSFGTFTVYDVREIRDWVAEHPGLCRAEVVEHG